MGNSGIDTETQITLGKGNSLLHGQSEELYQVGWSAK